MATPTADRPPLFQFRIIATPEATVCECSGRLTAADSAAFKSEMKELLVSVKRLVIDLTNLQFMDSSGLGAIVSIYVSARKSGCDFHLLHFNQRIRELFGLTHMLDIFEACGQFFIKMP